MTAGAGPGRRAVGPTVAIVAVGADGAEVLRLDLGHGHDPEDVLAQRGLRVERMLEVTGQQHPHVVELRYAVVPGAGTSGVVPRAVPVDAGLVLEPGESPHVLQRVAVYALLRSERGLLLAQMSDRTNAAGRWGLVGGGLDPGELPEAALRREVWEESGQRVDRAVPWRVTTSHWVGRAPSRRLEDFHAVRVAYDAWCDTPGDPVVHDVGGTTSASAWFRRSELAGLDLVTSWAAVLHALGPDFRPTEPETA